METVETIPRTALEIYEMLPEGTRCEVIDNTLYMSPAPTLFHQLLQNIIATEITVRVRKKAKIATGPVDVYFKQQKSAFQPDIAVVLNENKAILRKKGIYGAPDVVVELLSPDHKRDTVMKADVYEAAGVKEYFMVDPENCGTTLFSLVNGRFEMTYRNQKGIFRSSVLDLEFEFDYE